MALKSGLNSKKSTNRVTLNVR